MSYVTADLLEVGQLVAWRGSAEYVGEIQDDGGPEIGIGFNDEDGEEYGMEYFDRNARFQLVDSEGRIK